MDTEELYDSLEDDYHSLTSESNASDAKLSVVEEIEHDNTTHALVTSPGDILLNPEPKYGNLQNRTYISDNGLIGEKNIKSHEETLIKNDTITQHEGASLKGNKIKHDISSLIPLYFGDAVKTDVKPPTHSINAKASMQNHASSSQCFTRNSEKSYIPLRRFNKINYCKSVRGSCIDLIAQEPTRKTSYLKMFHDRIGYCVGQVSKNITDTARSTFGDFTERTSISGISGASAAFIDANDDASDTTSCYMRQIHDTRPKSGKTNRTGEQIGSNKTVFSSRNSATNNKTLRFRSVSEQAINLNDMKTRIVSGQHFIGKQQCMKVPMLGGLGPDTEAVKEKLERYKKQKAYGQKASYKNRIRMMEMKVLKNLKNEISACNILDTTTEEVTTT